MFERILFPVDFTGSSEKVVAYVRDVAKKYTATVHVIHVVVDTVDLYVPGETMISFLAEVREGAENMMRQYIDKHFHDMQDVVFGHILEGDPAEEIVRFAVENENALIIMATHGRKGLDRVVFGSVAENVLRSSPVPVLAVNPHRLEK
jgi:nucleotide-binding universal stress UspA family protein